MPETVGVFYLGGYTPDTGGSGVGIALVRHAGGRLTVESELAVSGPSFLAAHPRLPVLYAAHERDDGAVGAFEIRPDGTLALVAELPSGGAAPCHLAVDAAGSVLVVANYADGVVAVFRLDTDGLPAGPVWTLPGEGNGPDPERQAGPHAHQAVFAPDGALLVADLGADRIRRYVVDPEVAAHPAGPVPMRPGSGPRHLVGDGRGRWYVTNELDGTVAVYAEGSGGEWHETDRVPASSSTVPNLPSHLDLSADGRRLYVANRGPDSLSVFDVDGGRLSRRGEAATGGRWPRHFALAGDRIYVANQHSDAVTVLMMPPGEESLPEPTGEALLAGSPTCVLPAPTIMSWLAEAPGEPAD